MNIAAFFSDWSNVVGFAMAAIAIAVCCLLVFMFFNMPTETDSQREIRELREKLEAQARTDREKLDDEHRAYNEHHYIVLNEDVQNSGIEN